MLTATGSFTGNATARSITGVGFQPDLVLVKSVQDSYDTYFKTAEMAAAYSLPIRADGSGATNHITSIDSNGFSVSTDAAVNNNGKMIVWFAIKDDGSGDFKTLSYTGDDTDDKLVFTAFQPDFALIKPVYGIVGAMKYAAEVSATANSSSNRAIPNYQGTGSRSDLIYFGSDGLRVSNGSSSGGNLVNQSTSAHYGFVIKNVSGVAATGTYTGTGTSGSSINLGFQPAFIVAHREDTGEAVVQYQAQAGSGYSAPWDGSQLTGKITSVGSSGFSLGSDNNINGSGFTYYYLALAIRAPSLAQGNFLRVF